jgi:hypothetical protein
MKPNKLGYYAVEDTVTYKRTWIVQAESEEDACADAVDKGPNETLQQEQIDNTPYVARRITTREARHIIWISNVEENPREKGDDDGVEYGDPRDERDERRR